MDLTQRKPRGFAFVRYGHEGTAELAMQEMHDTNLGTGRNILVTMNTVKTYWKQDESGTDKVGNFV
jgi:RNA recognition motif-containing protein